MATARIAIALFAVMSFACAFTQNYEQLFVLRFLEGIGLGGEIPVASTYISEILRAERRGGRFLAYQMIFPVGLLGVGHRRRDRGADASAGSGCSLSVRCRRSWRCSCSAIARNRRAGSRRRGAWREADAIMTDIERIVSRNGAKPLPPVPDLAIQPLGNQTRWQELFQGRYLSRTFLVWVLWATSLHHLLRLAGWIPTLYREVYHLPLQQSLNYAIAGPAGSLHRFGQSARC